jgi:hypothetical protein
VYRFADGSRLTVTLAAYLAENPSKTEADFQALKKLSDGMYLAQARAENAQIKKNTPFEELEETALCHSPSAEDDLIREMDAEDEAEGRRQRLEKVRLALDKLTDVQRRRYLLHHDKGLSTWRIAELEGVNQSKIVNSLALAEKKSKKFWRRAENRGFKTGFSVHWVSGFLNLLTQFFDKHRRRAGHIHNPSTSGLRGPTAKRHD